VQSSVAKESDRSTFLKRQPQPNYPRFVTGVVFVTLKTMAKQKKKRNKVYKGAGASATQPTVTRISAVKRNKLQQWWLEKKRIAKPVGIATLVVIVIAWLLFELIRIIV
jgi:hypothetical protein